MFSSGFYITAELKVKDAAKVEEAKRELQALCAETLKEEGCDVFQLHHCNNDERRFLLWERFDDEAAFKLHFELPHTKDYIAKDLTEVVQYFQTDIA